MQSRKLPSAVAVAGLLAGALVGATGTGFAASAPQASPAPAQAAQITPGGRGVASARQVDVRALAKARQLPARGTTLSPLGRDGKPTGSALPAQSSSGRKTAPPASRPSPTGPNAGAPRAFQPRISPTVVDANFEGVNQTESGGLQPPDPNAAVSPAQIAHTVNLRLQVFSKTGIRRCGVGLNTLIGTTNRLADPRVQWDNLNNRFSLVVIPVPATTTSTPTLYVAASRTADACGLWFVYTVTFSGGLFPLGTLLDYPYLGQDRVAVLSSSNNFRLNAVGGFSYINSAAFSIPKAAIYSGARFSFPAFAVGFSTAPVTVSGIPIVPTVATYYLRSIPGTGYQLYRMTNSAGPGTTLAAQPVISSPFSAPTRRVRQPGTTNTLDPLDGRIPWAPVQDGGFVWFAHGFNIAGFPAVRYGAVGTTSNAAFVATAFKTGTSDDFNPSIGVFGVGAGVYIWLNWSYTDTPAGVPTTVTTNGVGSGEGVPSRIGGLNLFTGFITLSNFRFGDYSSVAIDPVAKSAVCPAGRTAVIAQEYFGADGRWRTRIGRLSFC